MSAEPVQLKMEDFTNIVMNVNVVSNNLGVIVKSVTDVLYQIMTSVQVIQLRKWSQLSNGLVTGALAADLSILAMGQCVR